jgi:hypothetical protein
MVEEFCSVISVTVLNRLSVGSRDGIMMTVTTVVMKCKLLWCEYEDNLPLGCGALYLLPPFSG